GRGDLEDAAAGAFGDEGVTVGQPLRARDVRAEKILWGLVHVFPDDLLRLPTHFDHARVGQPRLAAIGAVIEDGEVAVRQLVRAVLLRQHVVAETPDHIAGRAVDEHYC